MVEEILSEGKENAVPGRDLCAILGITRRELMAQVERERRAGAPICASMGVNPGYYKAKDQREMWLYCESLYRRGVSIIDTRRELLETLNTLPESEEF